jgi:hypothetical protein
MNHPFDLDAADLEAMDLDFEEQLTDEQAAQIGGGLKATTLALGEEGGGIVCISAPCPGSEGGGGFPPGPIPIDPPMTTLALGEEGGGPYTKAWFECGGGPIYW